MDTSKPDAVVLREVVLRERGASSFLPARLLPQLADTAELVAVAKALPSLVVSVLVPKVKGAERAIQVGADAMLLPLSASHAHSLASLRETPVEMVAALSRIVALRIASGSACRVEVGLSTAFGCTIQGEVSHAESSRLVQAVLDAGVGSMGLADTMGDAGPLQVNVLAAWQQGICRFGAWLAGIGGCPHAPGASGNGATEDVVCLFVGMGVPSADGCDARLALRTQAAGWLAGDALHGSIWRAGLPRTLRDGVGAGVGDGVGAGVRT